MSSMELFNNAARAVSQNGARMSYVEVHQVTGVTTDQCLGQSGVPQYGEGRDINGKRLMCVDRQARTTGLPDVSEVVCTFSNDQNFSGSPVNDDDNTFQAYTGGTFRAELIVPVSKARIVSIPSTTGPLERRAWEPAPITVGVGGLRISSTINMPRVRLSDMVAWANQTGKVHVFGGISWLFEGADWYLDEYTDETSRWKVSYKWINLPGLYPPVINGLTAEQQDNIVLPTETLYPFDRYVVVPSGNATDNRPQIKIIRIQDQGNYAPNGYQLLPGSPIQ